MSGIKIHVLKCGEIALAPEMAFGGAGYVKAQSASLLAPEGRRLRLPVFTYLLEHPNGLVLIDTGWSRDISPAGELDMNALTRHTSDFLARTFHGRVAMGQTADEQLAKLGVSAADIDCVLLSSLDADHVSNIHPFAGAKRLLCAEEEAWWAYRTNPNHCTYLWDDLNVEKYYFRGTGTGPDGRSYDLFGDGSVIVVSTPGHTKGSVVVKIFSDKRYVMLCSDNGYAARSWERLDMPGLAFNKQALKKSLEWIKKEAVSPDCVAALSSHDPDIKPQVIEI